MRKKHNKILPTEENIKRVSQLIKEKKYLTDIAKEYDVARDTVKKFILENKISMPSSVTYKKYDFTEGQIQCISTLLKRGCSLTLIGSLLNVDRSVVGRIVKENNISKDRDFNLKEFPLSIGAYTKFINKCIEIEHLNKSEADTKFQEWVNEELRNIECYAVKKKSQRFNLPPQEVLEYIQKNHTKKSVYQISSDLNIPEQRIRHYSRILGVKCHAYNTKITLPTTKEFEEDFKNPYFSTTALSAKYHIGYHVLQKARKEKFGNFNSMMNSYLNKSSAEIKFENILKELDLAFIYEYKINGWEIDYYLGQKIGIEINSSYHHLQITSVVEKDIRKNTELKNSGYTIKTFFDFELDDIDNVKKEIMQLIKNKWSHNLVNLEI